MKSDSWCDTCCKWIKHCWNQKKSSTSFLQVVQKFECTFHIVYRVSSRSPVWPHAQGAGGEKKFARFSSVSDGPGSLTSALPVFSSSPGFEGFSSHQSARAATSLLSQPLLPILHAQIHVDFHFSYSMRLAAPAPQGWLKTGGQTSSSVGGMHAGEMLPKDLFEAAVDSADEYSKHTCGCLGWAALWSVNLLSTRWPHTGTCGGCRVWLRESRRLVLIIYDRFDL